MKRSNDAQVGDSRVTWIALLATLAIFAYASFITSRSTLFDRDEPRFAEAAVEMIATGNALYPTFDFELRPDKPILVYWLMAGAIKMFGATAWAARFFSPVCLALACWLVFRIGKRLFDAKAGLIAMGLLAVSPLALMEGVVATTDALLLLCMTLVLSNFVAFVLDGPSALRYAGIALGTAAGLLTKGPVALAVVALSIAFTSWFLRAERTPTRRDSLRVWLALIAALVVFLAWGIPANLATNGEYAARGLGHHVVDRSTEALEGHGGNYFLWLPFYVPIAVIGFLPGLLFLPAACAAFLGQRIANVRTRALILGWIVPCVVLMTLVPTKLPHYILPVFPALSLAAAAVVGALERDQLSDRERAWASSGTWIFGAVAIVLAAALGLVPYFQNVDGLLTPSLVMAGALGVTALVAMRMHRRGRHAIAAYVVIFGCAATWMLGAVLALPIVERTKVAPDIAAAIRSGVPESVTVARWKFSEPSLDFYLGRPPIKDFDDEAQLRAWALENSPAVLVIQRDRLERLRDVLPTSRWSELAVAHGFNLSKGQAIELVAIVRELPTTQDR
ncbi:MAG: glycosyltransferase family 39 protein [Planctomycetota bacterium]|nr:glycosyltransferase family 39 protein [Planctomycetota bacterium]